MPTITHYCGNPLNKQNHKKKRTWMFKQVDAEFMEKHSAKSPDLSLKMYLCVACRMDIEKMRKVSPCISDPPEAMEIDSEDEIQPSQQGSSTSSISSASASSEMSLDPEVQILEAERKLKAVTKVLEIQSFVRDSKKQVRLNNAERYWKDISTEILKLLFVTSEFNASKSQQKGNTPNGECNYCIKLINDLKSRFFEVATKADKYKILTSLPAYLTIDAVVANFNCSQYMARESSKLRLAKGAFSSPAYKAREGTPESVKSLIRNFYLSTDNSRVNPAVRGTIMVRSPGETTRKAEAKRLIMLTLSDLYSEFCQKYPEIDLSVSSFSLLRPPQCVWSGTKGFQNTCTCSIHQNFELVLNACKISSTISDVFSRCFCDSNSEKCMMRLCSNCPKEEEIDTLFTNIEDEDFITYNFWGTLDGQYGTQLLTLSKPLSEFQQMVRDLIPSVAAHHFVMKKQQSFISFLKNEKLKQENSGLMQLDFAQNYAFLYPNEIQSFYYTNRQATVHPCVFSWYSHSAKEVKTKSYVVISDHLEHNATAVHAFISKVLENIKLSHPRINKIYYLSDGAASQYKNVKNFANLLYHKADFGLSAEWHFTATSHGKGQCDAMGAVTKRSLRLASLKLAKPGEPQLTISTALEMFSHCVAKLSSITLQYLLVSSEDIENISLDHNLQRRYTLAEMIPGTRSHHSFVPVSETEIQIKRFSLSEHSRIFNVTKASTSNDANVGQFIGISTEKQFTVGMVAEVDMNQLEYTVQIMQRRGKGNSFSWYEPSRTSQIVFDDVVRVIEPPVPTSSTGRYYKLAKVDLDALKAFQHRSKIVNK